MIAEASLSPSHKHTYTQMHADMHTTHSMHMHTKLRERKVTEKITTSWFSGLSECLLVSYKMETITVILGSPLRVNLEKFGISISTVISYKDWKI